MHRLVSFVFLLILAAPNAVWAENYEMSVTRKGANLYKVDGKDIYVVTHYCYEYVYFADVILRLSGHTGDIIFLDKAENCDVKGVYASSDQASGKYEVTVSQESDDWYEVYGMNLFVRTSLCPNPALVDSAILSIFYQGYGTLYFSDGEECVVEGVYARLGF